jgi:hypothetical protein
MTATLYDISPARRHDAPRLVAVAPRRRRPLSATIALFGLGMTPGFLLAGAVSAQGGAGMVATAWTLAGISAVVTVAAAVRSRQIAVRRRRRLAQRARAQTNRGAPIPLRRAA